MKKNVVLGLLSLLSCIALVACVCIAVCYNFGNDGGDNLIHTHTLTLVGEKQASCAEEGNIAYYVCDGCGRFFSDEAGEIEITDKSSVVTFIPHTLTPVEGKEATCTQKGNTPYYTCGVCGKWFSDADGKSEITDKDSVSVGLQAHAFRNGKCEKCGTAHGCKYTPTVTPPTCIQQGFTAYTCECGASYTADYKDTVDHDYFNGKCRICGGEHDCKYTDAVTEPTCTEKGFTAHTCACGASYIDGYTDALGHDYIDGECTRCGHFNYTVGLAYSLSDDGTYYICTGIGESTGTEIIIPSMYNGLPVTEIGDYAFISCSKLTQITLSNGITTVENYAFYNCRSLTSINIPASVTKIGINAFTDCESLESITVSKENKRYYSLNKCLIEAESKTLILGCKNSVIPADGSVTSIGDYAFYACKSLTSISIPAGVTSIGVCAFGYCSKLESIYFGGTIAEWELIEKRNNWDYNSGNYLLTCSDGEKGKKYTEGLLYFRTANNTYTCSGIGSATDTEIIIPSKIQGLPVTEIGDRAFKDCDKITVLIIPDSVTSIGLAAFQNCSSLTKIILPDSVTSIGNYAFYGCSNLTEITIPAGVEALGSYTFTSCPKLEKINFKGTVAQWQAIPHTDWLYISDCTVVCTDGEIKGGQITLR